MTAEELLTYFEKLAALFKPSVTVNVSYTDNRVDKDESTYVDKNFMGGDSNMCGCGCGCTDPECNCVCHWSCDAVGEDATCTVPDCPCTCHSE